MSRDHIFPWGAMQLALCWEVGLEMEGRKPGLVVSWVAPILSGCHHPVGGEGRSRGAGAEALRVRFELILFSLGAHFPLSWQQHLYPRGELRPSLKGLIGCLVWARGLCQQLRLCRHRSSRSPGHSNTAAGCISALKSTTFLFFSSLSKSLNDLWPRFSLGFAKGTLC